MKNFLLTWWPVFFIVSIWFIFASPFFLKGRVPFPSTYQVNNFAPWDAYPGFASPVKNGAMPDLITQIYPWKHFTIETYKKGEIPLWNPYSFAGTPHMANYQSAIFSPFNLLFFVFSFVNAWSLLVLLQPLLAGIFMYMFVRRLKISLFGSLISSISFMFCGFMTVWMDYATLGYAILFLPLALYAIESFYQTIKVRYLFILSFSLPLSFFSGHFQISIYFVLCIFVYWVFTFFKKKQRKNSFIILFCLLSGLLMTLPQILPSIEFYQQSLRSNIFQKGEVIPWMYLPTFLAPDFFGNPVTRNDWFGHYAEWNGYIGVLPLMLGMYALKIKRNSHTIFFFILGILTLLCTLPTPFLDILFALHIPVLATSAASRIIVLCSFSFTILAGFGFDALFADIKQRNIRSIAVWLVSFLGIFVFLWIWIFLKLFLPIEKIVIAKQNILLPTVIFIGVIVCVGVSLLPHRYFKGRLAAVSMTMLLLIVCFDMVRFATKWQPFDPKNLVFTDVPVSKELQHISGYQRGIGNFGAEAAVYYGVGALGGYDPLYIDRYGEFISAMRYGYVHSGERSVVTFDIHSPYTAKAINLLNVGYIIHKRADDYVGWTFPYWDYSDQFKSIYADSSYTVFKNMRVFPRAILVNSYSVISNKDKIFSKMFAKDVNLESEIILEKDPHIDQSKVLSGSIAVTGFTPNMMNIAVTTASPTILFTSDPYYPGWKAYVDNQETEILRADYAFRAIIVPSGKHSVRFVYQPQSFMYGLLAAGIGLVSLVSISFFTKRKKDHTH